MIGFVFGTTAEVIKAAPVLLSITPTPSLIFTGQHQSGCDALLDRVGLPSPRFRLNAADAPDLASTREAPAWAWRIFRSAASKRREIRAALAGDGFPPVILVQGDTLSTLAGAILGKATGAQVAHVEAGARSGDLRNPFPEEGVRRLVDRLADVMYAAGDAHARNVVQCRGDVVNTDMNTGLDALRLALWLTPDKPPPDGSYGIVTLHRFELLRQRTLLRRTVRAILEARTPVSRIVMPLDAHSRHYMQRAGVLDALSSSTRVLLVPKIPFPTFQHWLVGSRFVVTDSGGLSQECGYLGLPCLIHRDAEEGVSGARGSLMLSHFDTSVLQGFMENPPEWPGPDLRGLPFPSLIVARDLASRGLIRGSGTPEWALG